MPYASDPMSCTIVSPILRVPARRFPMNRRYPAAERAIAPMNSGNAMGIHRPEARFASGLALALLVLLTCSTASVAQSTNQAPAITSASSATFLISSLNTFTIASTGTPTASLTVTGALPSGSLLRTLMVRCFAQR
jgi:hypothetical protein